jgi:hypothetical protein
MSYAPTPEAAKAAAAFIDEIGTQGWATATLEGAARRAGLAVGDLVAAGGDRWGLLDLFGRHVDSAAAREADAEGGSQAVRDRLFGLIMARFDVLTDHRDGIRALMRGLRSDPGLAAYFACRVPRAMRVLADAAGVETTGPLGSARVHALTALYLSVVRTWLDDDSEDLAKTMKALDEALARAERWAERLSNPFGKRASRTGDASPASPDDAAAAAI